jgi:hypothetical protein
VGPSLPVEQPGSHLPVVEAHDVVAVDPDPVVPFAPLERHPEATEQATALLERSVVEVAAKLAVGVVDDAVRCRRAGEPDVGFSEPRIDALDLLAVAAGGLGVDVVDPLRSVLVILTCLLENDDLFAATSAEIVQANLVVPDALKQRETSTHGGETGGPEVSLVSDLKLQDRQLGARHRL